MRVRVGDPHGVNLSLGALVWGPAGVLEFSFSFSFSFSFRSVGWVAAGGSRPARGDPPCWATHPARPTRQNKNKNEKKKNENSRTPAGPQTNAPRDNITPCGSPIPHSN